MLCAHAIETLTSSFDNVGLALPERRLLYQRVVRRPARLRAGRVCTTALITSQTAFARRMRMLRASGVSRWGAVAN
jgi:hypothetical protein